MQPTLSSPWVCPLKPEFQHPAPACTSWCERQAGECRQVARTLCAGLALLCLPQTGCCTLLPASEAPFLSWLISLPVKGLPRVQEHFLFHSSLPGVQILSWFPFLFFPFIPPLMWRLLALLGVWDMLPVLSSYSVRIIPHVDVLFFF